MTPRNPQTHVQITSTSIGRHYGPLPGTNGGNASSANRKSGKKSGFGVWGVWGDIVIVHCIKRMVQKLSGVILLHFGLIAFRLHFGRIHKVIIFMIFGPSGRDHDSPNQLSLTLDTPNYSKRFRNNPESFLQNIWFVKISEYWKSAILKVVEKTGPTNPEDPSSNIYLEDEINHYPKT